MTNLKQILDDARLAALDGATASELVDEFDLPIDLAVLVTIDAAGAAARWSRT